jgi:hypothetical protein
VAPTHPAQHQQAGGNLGGGHVVCVETRSVAAKRGREEVRRARGLPPPVS